MDTVSNQILGYGITLDLLQVLLILVNLMWETEMISPSS